MKRLAFAVIAVAMGLGLSACDDRDVARGAAAVGAGFILGAAYDHNRGYDYRYTRRGYHDNYYYWDRYDGRWIRSNGRWYRYYNHTAPNNIVPAALTEPASAERALASKYHLNARGTRLIMKTLNSVKATGRLDAFREIGLSNDDISRLRRGHMPGSRSIRLMGDHLMTNTVIVKAILRDLQDEFSLQRQHNFNL